MTPSPNVASKEFTEFQRFNSRWMWTIIGGLIISGTLPIIGAMAPGFPPEMIPVIILISLFPVCIAVVIGTGYLKTTINSSGIFVEMKILIKFKKHFLWSEIESIAVDRYKPIKEFGGWGIRMGRNSIAYSTSGNEGLILKLNSSKKVVIGTKRSTDLHAYLFKF